MRNKSHQILLLSLSLSQTHSPMAVSSSTFSERLRHLDEARKERLSLLRSEKKLHAERSHLLRGAISNLRSADRRLLLLEKRLTELELQIVSKKSQIDALDAKYQASAQRFRDLKWESEDAEAKEKERERFYDAKRLEMEEFKGRTGRRAAEAREEVETMRVSSSRLISSLKDLRANDGYVNNSEIAAAERRKDEVLAVREDLDKGLVSNYELRSLLQKQLQKTLASQTREGGSIG